MTSNEQETNRSEQEYESPETGEVEEAPRNEEEANKREPFFSRAFMRQTCYPHVSTTPHALIPLALCLLALTFTGIGSWDCKYFEGATISFTGSNYGLWTLQDSTGKCQLWDVLFFSYQLDPFLKAARFFSMASMLLGLALTAVLTQALQFHACSWGVGGVFAILLLASLLTHGIFNVWALFFLFTFVIFIVIVRALFIHPVHRRISKTGHRFISFNFALCALYCLLTLVVLRSDFCTCKNITSDTLEGREPGSPCDGSCELGTAGGLMIGAAALWMVAAWAVLRFGVQPEILKENAELREHIAHYPRDSITTRVLRITNVQTGDTLSEKAKTLAVDSSRTAAEIDDESPEEVGVVSKEQEETLSDEQEDEPSGVRDDEPSDEPEDEASDNRRRCQKMCFDYRVTPRSRRERWLYWSFRTMLGFLVLLYVIIIVVLIGSFSENSNAHKAPDTSYNFITDVVCAFNPLDSLLPFETFPTKQNAIDAGYIVAHCGACGLCSNSGDIQTFVETRKTVAKLARKCGATSIFKSRDDLVECLEDRIGFSPVCTECWADNMRNTAKYCVLTCMKTMMTGLGKDNNINGAGGDGGWLNQCIFCDEKRSGPNFVKCSGVARRRLGIVSEIERNPEEQCKNTNIDWLTVRWPEIFPESNSRL